MRLNLSLCLQQVVRLTQSSRHKPVGYNRLISLGGAYQTVRAMSSKDKDDKRCVLSIQSHVVHGFVGNKCATFPLQVLGFEVDAINSVQFSTHTGYGPVKGQVLNENQIGDLFEGLEKNNLLHYYSHLLTGYIGDKSFLSKVAGIAKKLREVNPNLVYVCDPVLGDNGRMYVPESLIPVYRDDIIPLANIATPNQFEVELLTGKVIKSEADAWEALQWFHDQGVHTVALSSTDLGPSGTLLAFLSHCHNNKRHQYQLSIPRQGNGINFIGTGDTFTALFLAHSHLVADVGTAFENTIGSLQAIIKNTISALPQGAKAIDGKIRCDLIELKMIQSKRDIETPNVVLKAIRK